MLPSHRANAAGYALYPLQLAEQRPSHTLTCIAQALSHGKLKDEAESLAKASIYDL